MDNVNSIFLGKVEKEEILNTVKSCASKGSTDCVDMDMILVKNIIELVIEPFTYICNLSFSSGVFPDNMKTAKVIPLYKNGDKHVFSNYRPVSLLPQFSKILEKLFVIRLDKFIDRYNVLSNSQNGFRTNHSTSMALMELTEEISTAIDKRQYFVSIFVDLKKAFDTIDHTILLKKLSKYSIRGVAHKLVSSYLENRKQYVQINNVKSESHYIQCGVPQGSVPGPKLFILYSNDFVYVSKLLKCILFVDDTTLFYCEEDITQVLSVVKQEFKRLKTWFDVNKLSLNLEKTNFMKFSNRGRDTGASINIDGIEINRVRKTKFLGVILDENLCWKSHIHYTKAKISKTIAMLHKVKDSLDSRALYILYNTMIVPYLTYCIEVWGNACKTYTQSIFILQKRAIRIITRKRYRDPTNPLFLQLKLLKFNELVDYSILQIMLKAHKKNFANQHSEKI